MRRHRRRTAEPQFEINVTPMGDVALCLLLGFLVVTPMIIETMSATLPQGGGAASGQTKQIPVVIINAERRITVDGKEVAREDLPAKLRELFPPGVQMERKVLFTGAGDVPYDEIVSLLDLLKENGVETFGIR
jgi:biopolymer transport protein ExbD